MNILTGWKTHLVTTLPAIGLLLVVLVEKFVVDIPGIEVPTDWVTLVLGGLGFGALRSSIVNK